MNLFSNFEFTNIFVSIDASSHYCSDSICSDSRFRSILSTYSNILGISLIFCINTILEQNKIFCENSNRLATCTNFDKKNWNKKKFGVKLYIEQLLLETYLVGKM